MSTQELILISKENYRKNQPKASEFLHDPKITAKTQQHGFTKKRSRQIMSHEVKAYEIRDKRRKSY